MRSNQSWTWEIWTDGSSQGKRIEWKDGYICERGGYGAVITRDGKIIDKVYQGFRNTTNNRMELSGVLEGLRWFKEPSNIIIYSDSQYIEINTIVDKNEYLKLMNFITKVDPSAFVTVYAVNEMRYIPKDKNE